MQNKNRCVWRRQWGERRRGSRADPAGGVGACVGAVPAVGAGVCTTLCVSVSSSRIRRLPP